MCPFWQQCREALKCNRCSRPSVNGASDCKRKQLPEVRQCRQNFKRCFHFKVRQQEQRVSLTYSFHSSSQCQKHNPGQVNVQPLLTSIPHHSVKAYELVRDLHAKKRQEYFSRKPRLLQSQQNLGKLSFLTVQEKKLSETHINKTRGCVQCAESLEIGILAWKNHNEKNMHLSLTLNTVCIKLHSFLHYMG